MKKIHSVSFRVNVLILLLGIILVLAVDLASFRGVNIREKIIDMNLVLRWMIIIPAILIILLCGIWGGNYDAASFIYQQF